MQKYEYWLKILDKADKLLIPTRTDWIIAAKSVRRLRHLKLIDKNLSPTALQNDALIARSSLMNKCFVVTDNIRDYALLQKVMPKLEVIPAGEFFN